MTSSDAGRHHFEDHVRGRHGWRWDELEPSWRQFYRAAAAQCRVCHPDDLKGSVT